MLHSKSIGNKIAVGRKRLNLSQSELAQKVFISAQAVGKWERGESMPDITTLNTLAEILGVDLNYFSDNFESTLTETNTIDLKNKAKSEDLSLANGKKPSWDLSKLNLVDSDFSGLKNLHEKFGSTNMQHCLFVGSNLSGLVLNSNNIENCDFTNSDISNSQIQNSNLDNNIFKNCSLKSTQFVKSNISKCDFTYVDFTKTKFNWSNFGENNLSNAIWNETSFIAMNIQDIIFEGTLDGCYFENCSFYSVKFQNTTITNTFFKNNKKLKRVLFSDCKVDAITFAFLKNGGAEMSGITIIT